MTLQFYMTPGACCTGIHILLEELDLPFAVTVLKLMDYAVGTVHGQGFTRIFTTERYLPAGLVDADRATGQLAVQALGRERVAQAFAIIEARLPATGYAVGGDFSVADAALFYVAFWADKTGLSLPPCSSSIPPGTAPPLLKPGPAPSCFARPPPMRGKSVACTWSRRSLKGMKQCCD